MPGSIGQVFLSLLLLLSVCHGLSPWVGPLSHIYTDGSGCPTCNGCPNIGIHSTSLADCQLLCANTVGEPSKSCTAINWGPDQTGKTAGGCVLRACQGGTSLTPTAATEHDIHGYYCNGTRAECKTTSPPGPAQWPASLGQARFRLQVTNSTASAPAVLATVAWRRRDQLPGLSTALPLVPLRACFNRP